MSDYKLVPMEATHKDMESVWMYKGSDGEWKPFVNEQHRLNTIADGGWEVREFFAAPIVQGEPVAFRYRTSESTMWNYVDWRGPDEVEKDNFEIQYPIAAPQPAPDVASLVEALEDVVSEIESNTCPHDNTYRGGAIWEICEDCGEKWADDMGGKPEFAWPESVETARNLIHSYRKGGD